jgi:hypothetical protein
MSNFPAIELRGEEIKNVEEKIKNTKNILEW